MVDRPTGRADTGIDEAALWTAALAVLDKHAAVRRVPDGIETPRS
jgi:hypothetical protein